MDEPGRALVRVVPGGPEFTVIIGESIMTAAERHGFRWPTVCHGNGDCLACRVRVLEGAGHLSEASEGETQRLEPIRQRQRSLVGEWRLACQARVLGDVVVEKRGVREQ
jgi:2Fe-2S ferredoxin